MIPSVALPDELDHAAMQLAERRQLSTASQHSAERSSTRTPELLVSSVLHSHGQQHMAAGEALDRDASRSYDVRTASPDNSKQQDPARSGDYSEAAAHTTLSACP